MFASSSAITAWNSKGLSNESIKPPATSDNSLNPATHYNDSAKIRVKFDGSCLKQDKVTFTPKVVLNVGIVYEINLRPYDVGKDFAFRNSLFGAVNMPYPYKYSYCEYAIGFCAHRTF